MLLFHQEVEQSLCTILNSNSNLGFALLGQVLGAAFGNGRGFQGWMKDNLLSTLGMTGTTFTLDERYEVIQRSF